MKIRQVGSDFFHADEQADGRTDRRTDRHNEVKFALRDYANALKNAEYKWL